MFFLQTWRKGFFGTFLTTIPADSTLEGANCKMWHKIWFKIPYYMTSLHYSVTFPKVMQVLDQSYL